jgi:aurora kinase
MVSKAEFKLTDFHLLKKMGSGSYSEVYMAMEKRSGFICALKILEKQKMKEMKV